MREGARKPREIERAFAQMRLTVCDLRLRLRGKQSEKLDEIAVHAVLDDEVVAAVRHVVPAAQRRQLLPATQAGATLGQPSWLEPPGTHLWLRNTSAEARVLFCIACPSMNHAHSTATYVQSTTHAGLSPRAPHVHLEHLEQVGLVAGREREEAPDLPAHSAVHEHLHAAGRQLGPHEGRHDVTDVERHHCGCERETVRGKRGLPRRTTCAERHGP